MAIRPLVYGILFIAVFVAIVLSMAWVDRSRPTHQPDALVPVTPAPTTPVQ